MCKVKNLLRKTVSGFSAAAVMASAVMLPWPQQQNLLSVPKASAEVTEICNPIIWADVPDVDVIRVDDTYYMISTTMFFTPGAPIMKSKDLVSWEICSYVYDVLDNGNKQTLTAGEHDYAHGSWAASLRYHDGMFYVFFGSYGTGKSYIYKTNDIENGTWTRSEINGMYHDASLFFDDDGKNYLVFGGGGEIKIKELNAEMTGFQYGAQERTLFKTGLSGLSGEGSHIQKINGKYYVFIIAWPSGSGRIELCYRSDSVFGPYEGKTVLDSGIGTYGSGVAQGGIVETPDGKWYGMLFQDHGSVGRIPALVPVTWQDGWPVMGVNGKVPVTFTVDTEFTGTALAKSDDFDYDSNNLALEWQWNHNPDNMNWSVTDRPGWLRLKNGSLATNLLNARNTLTQRAEGPACSSVIKLDASNMKPGDYAGLSAFQFNYGNVGVYVNDSGSKKVYMAVNGGYSSSSAVTDSYNKIVAEKDMYGDTVYLKVDFRFGTVDASKNISYNIDKANFYYSFDGNNWEKIGDELGMTYDLKLFTGYRSGIYSYATKQTGGFADIDFFSYEKESWNPALYESSSSGPDENGFYFKDEFEGSDCKWSGRGSATASAKAEESYSGTGALCVTGREASWNGAIKALSKSSFKPGEEYSFSAVVKYNEGTPQDDFYLTLQYNVGDSTYYEHIAEARATKGEYVQLKNTNYKIPEGASSMYLILETIETKIDFYADEVCAAVAGKQIDGPEPIIEYTLGDISNDGSINIIDVCMLKRMVISNEESDKAVMLAADINKDDIVNVKDLVVLYQYMLGVIPALENI